MLTTMHSLIPPLEQTMFALQLPKRPGYGWTLLISICGYDQPRIGWAGPPPAAFSTRSDLINHIEAHLAGRGFRCHQEACWIDGRDYGPVVAVTGYELKEDQA